MIPCEAGTKYRGSDAQGQESRENESAGDPAQCHVLGAQGIPKRAADCQAQHQLLCHVGRPAPSSGAWQHAAAWRGYGTQSDLPTISLL